MNRLDILAHLALVPQDVPDVVAAGASLKRVYVRHFPEGVSGDGLNLEAELTADESAHVETIRAALAGDTGAFDPSLLISVVTFLAAHPELVKGIFGLLRRKQ